MGVISPMRPACQDGVVTAHGYLFWGPWMCRCDLTQLGVISLGPGGDFNYTAEASDAERLETADTGIAENVRDASDDWPTFRKDNARSSVTKIATPAAVGTQWEYKS